MGLSDGFSRLPANVQAVAESLMLPKGTEEWVMETAMKKGCVACGIRCNADRNSGRGFCGIDDKIYAARFGLHFGEEPFFTGEGGSGTVFFAGCSLRCRFCQNAQISRFTPQAGAHSISTEELADIFRKLADMGAENINLVSPTPYAELIGEAIAVVKADGFGLPFVYNSHGNDSPETVARLAGLIDVWLPDVKYGSNSLGRKYSGADNLWDNARKTVRLMYEISGRLRLNARGLAYAGVAVRHLILPDEIESSLSVIDFLETVDRGVYLSLMSQYRPPEWGDDLYPNLGRKLREDEYLRVTEYAKTLGFDNIMLQDMSSSDSFVPDFNKANIFGDENEKKIVSDW